MTESKEVISFVDPFGDLEAEGGAPGAAGGAPDAFDGVPDAHPAPPGAEALLGPPGGKELPGDMPDWASLWDATQPPTWCVDCGKRQYNTPGGAVCINGHGGALGIDPREPGEAGGSVASITGAGSAVMSAAPVTGRESVTGAGSAVMSASGARAAEAGASAIRRAVEASGVRAIEVGAPSAHGASVPKARERAQQVAPYGRTLWDAASPRPEGEDGWIPQEHIDDFAARGLEMCLEVPRKVGGETHMQELWVVPKTADGADRLEISYRDLATIANCLIAFPGAKVTELKLMGTKKNEGK